MRNENSFLGTFSATVNGLSDMSRVNSSTIYALNMNVDPVKQKSFEHGLELVMQLVKPHIAMRNQTKICPWLSNERCG